MLAIIGTIELIFVRLGICRVAAAIRIACTSRSSIAQAVGHAPADGNRSKSSRAATGDAEESSGLFGSVWSALGYAEGGSGVGEESSEDGSQTGHASDADVATSALFPSNPLDAARMVLHRPELERDASIAACDTAISAGFEIRPDEAIVNKRTGAVYDVTPWLKVYAQISAVQIELVGELPPALVESSPRLWADGGRSFRPALPADVSSGTSSNRAERPAGWYKRWVQNIVRHVGKLAMACRSPAAARALIDLQGRHPVRYGEYVALRLRVDEVKAECEMHSA